MTNRRALATRDTARAPAPTGEERLALLFQYAQSYARGGDNVPRGYRGNVGACLLAIDWAEHHGMSHLEAIQSVAFVQGRPVIDATAQRGLAGRAGYDVVPTDTTPTYSTVSVSRAGKLIGKATYTVDDAERAGLLGKDNWKKNPEDMLVARATSRAVRRFCPSVLFGMGAPDDDDVQVAAPETYVGEPTQPVEVVEVEGQLTLDDAIAVPTEEENDSGSLPNLHPNAVGTTEAGAALTEAEVKEAMRETLRDEIAKLDTNPRRVLRAWMATRGWKVADLELDQMNEVRLRIAGKAPVE